jgi:hypothetical protein
MKKIVCVIAVVLMIASVVYAAEKKGITAKDIAGLKGTYQGTISFGLTTGMSSGATLEILNDTVPVKGKLTIDSMPDQVAQAFGVMSGKNVAENDNGKLTSMGTIMFEAGGDSRSYLEVSLGSSAKKLNVYYFVKGIKGEGSFTKK